MLEQPPELAPDLEWMLQGAQVSEGLILETAVNEYYERAFHVALTFLDDLETARQAVREAFIAVIENRHRYWGQISAENWILRQVLHSSASRSNVLKMRRAMAAMAPSANGAQNGLPEPQTQIEADTWLCFDSLAWKDRIAFLMIRIHGFAIQDAAEIVQAKAGALQRRVGRAERRLERSLGNEVNVLVHLQTRWPRHSFSKQDLADAGKAIISGLEKRGHKARLASGVRQSLLAIVLFLFISGIVWLTNQIASQETANPFSAPTVIVTQIVRVPVYLDPTPVLEHTPEPLNAFASDEQVWARIAESSSSWYTIWVEANIYQFGTAGYVGSPNVRRDQVWVERPFSSLVVSGPVGGEVDKVWYGLRGRVYLIDLDSQEPYFYDFHSESQPVYSGVSDLLSPENLDRGGSLDIIGMDNTAGRETLVVDLLAGSGVRNNRLWIDVYTGVLLGLREYGPDGDAFVSEIMVSKVYYDVIFPNRFYDRMNLITFFVEDYHGTPMSRQEVLRKTSLAAQPGHVRMEKISPPPDFDPAVSHLTFQWSLPPEMEASVGASGFNWSQWEQDTAGFHVNLFADAYHLADLEMDSPWHLYCGRSPDGSKIVLAQQPERARIPVTQLQWLDLNLPHKVHDLLLSDSIFGSDFAFSPDSRFLVFYGCLRDTLDCGVYRLDTMTLEERRLASIGYVDSFVWNPDGSEIAMLGMDDSLYVMQVEDGKITYQGREVNDDRLYQDAPVKAWEVSFPPVRTGLEGCTFAGI